MCIRDRLERMLVTSKVHKPRTTNKVLVEGEIHYGSYMEAKPLSAIMLPHGCLVAVSYTHLDVYKRQALRPASLAFLPFTS